MANTLNAFGFRQYSGTGSAPTYEQVRMRIKNGNTTAIFRGDPVVQATDTSGLATATFRLPRARSRVPVSWHIS